MIINIAFLTVIYPEARPFFYEFFNSLLSQSQKNFDLFIVNDGVEEFSELADRYSELSIIEVKNGSTHLENRLSGIDYILSLEKYGAIIFGDIDDYFAPNRIEVISNKLDYADIVANDIDIVIEKNVSEPNYFSNRVDNNGEIDFTYILDKNLLGLSNTAIRTDSITINNYPRDIIAFDWYFFSSSLFANKIALFTNETTTFYRQHNHNLVGLGVTSVESFKFSLKVKQNNYYNLMLTNKYFGTYYEETMILKEKVYEASADQLRLLNIQHPLWWETTHIIDKL